MRDLQKKNLDLMDKLIKMYKASYFPIINYTHHILEIEKGANNIEKIEKYVVFLMK